MSLHISQGKVFKDDDWMRMRYYQDENDRRRQNKNRTLGEILQLGMDMVQMTHAEGAEYERLYRMNTEAMVKLALEMREVYEKEKFNEFSG